VVSVGGFHVGTLMPQADHLRESPSIPPRM